MMPSELVAKIRAVLMLNDSERQKICRGRDNGID